MNQRPRFIVGLLTILLIAMSGRWTAIVSAQGDSATPVAGDVSTLEMMLHLAPDVLASETPPQVQIASFADVEAQLAAVGVTAPNAAASDVQANVDWYNAVSTVVLPDFIFVRNADWRAVFGFDLLQVDQSLVIGEPPTAVTILRGRFDEAAIAAALTAAEYQTIESADAAIYSLDPEERVSFTSQVGRLALARMNNVALLPDGILIAAPRLDLLQSVIATATGSAPSLADRPDVRMLLDAQTQPLATAMLLPGTVLTGLPFDPIDLVSGTPANIDDWATRIAEIGVMPPVILTLLGTTPGGPLISRGDATPVATESADDLPPAEVVINLLMPDAASAALAVRVATNRLATHASNVDDRPFSDIFASWEGEAVPGTSVAHLRLQLAEGTSPTIWLQLLSQRDLTFIAW